MTNIQDFFKKYRLKYGKLNKSQVIGLEFLINNMQAIDKRHASYMLATVKHECADKWQPIVEFGKKSYFDKYEPGTRIGTRLGNTKKGDGYLYRGRSFVQITGRANYKRLGAVLTVPKDLVANPDLCLDKWVAAEIMQTGMNLGLFTGKKLSDYINDDKCDYVNARRIINGMDQAKLIAGYAEFFESIL